MAQHQCWKNKSNGPELENKKNKWNIEKIMTLKFLEALIIWAL